MSDLSVCPDRKEAKAEAKAEAARGAGPGAHAWHRGTWCWCDWWHGQPHSTEHSFHLHLRYLLRISSAIVHADALSNQTQQAVFSIITN